MDPLAVSTRLNSGGSSPVPVPIPPGLLGGAGFAGRDWARCAAHSFAVHRVESDASGAGADDEVRLRCYEQLSLVFEMTEHIARLRSPAEIERALLRRSAEALRADAVFRTRNGLLERFKLRSPTASAVPDGPTLRRTLRRELDAVCTGGRALAAARAGNGGATAVHALIGAWRRPDAAPGAVVYVRGPGRTAFDDADAEACDTILTYGAQIIRNARWVNRIRRGSYESVCALVQAMDRKDSYTLGHSERVGVLARLVGRALGMSDAELCLLEWAGLLHDVGKIAIPEAILNKPGRLTPEEFAVVRQHPRASYDVLSGVRHLAPILPAVLHHHENHDGSGYPDGLAGGAIPLSARILHVADVFDALTSDRAYRAGYSVARAFGILIDNAGRVTDPNLTRLFIEVFKRYVAEFPDDFARRFRLAS